MTVHVPIACWRKGHAREFLETEPLPPPSTCYGFLLALVGEEDRRRYIGARVTAGIVEPGAVSVVLRTLWRVKSKDVSQGAGNNARPDYQQLVCGSRLTVWVDGGIDRDGGQTLETRVRSSLDYPTGISRFGGLSLGESTHLVNAVDPITDPLPQADTFLLAPRGRLTLPVWVDHVGTAGTRQVTGNLVNLKGVPNSELVPTIVPPAA